MNRGTGRRRVNGGSRSVLLRWHFASADGRQSFKIRPRTADLEKFDRPRAHATRRRLNSPSRFVAGACTRGTKLFLCIGEPCSGRSGKSTEFENPTADGRLGKIRPTACVTARRRLNSPSRFVAGACPRGTKLFLCIGEPCFGRSGKSTEFQNPTADGRLGKIRPTACVTARRRLNSPSRFVAGACTRGTKLFLCIGEPCSGRCVEKTVPMYKCSGRQKVLKSDRGRPTW